MSPLLPDRSFAVFAPAGRLSVDDIVLADHPRFGRIVKSVRAIENDGIWLQGCSARSTSTEALGPVPVTRVLGRLALRISAPGDRGGQRSFRRAA